MNKVIPVPPNDRLVLELMGPVEERTAGGLYVPETAAGAKDAVLRYKVVQVGPGLWSTDGLRRCGVLYSVGDVVLCNKPPEFREYKWCGRTLTVLNEADVLGGYSEGVAATGAVTLEHVPPVEHLPDPRGRITIIDGDPAKAIIAVAEADIAELDRRSMFAATEKMIEEAKASYLGV